MNTTPPTACPAWAKLAAHAESWREARLRELFGHDARRGEHFGARAPGLALDYSRQRVGALALRLLAQLAEERGLADWRRALFAGEPINATESRAVRATPSCAPATRRPPRSRRRSSACARWRRTSGT